MNANQIIHKEWTQDAVSAPVILKVVVKSKVANLIRVGIKLSVADNERKNITLPLTDLKVDVFGNNVKDAFMFYKIDPSKEGWGDITCEVEAKQGKTA